MLWPWLLALALALILVLVFLAWAPLKRWGGEVQFGRARELLHLQRERLQEEFLRAAEATGKPRGLRWVECLFEDEVEFARDRRSRQVVALIAATVRFEAVAGSDMEGLPAVSNLRVASAVFHFHAGRWQTHGRALFNLNPSEALLHLREQLEAIGPDRVVGTPRPRESESRDDPL